jgi:hypothetical protein
LKALTKFFFQVCVQEHELDVQLSQHLPDAVALHQPLLRHQKLDFRHHSHWASFKEKKMLKIFNDDAFTLKFLSISIELIFWFTIY